MKKKKTTTSTKDHDIFLSAIKKVLTKSATQQGLSLEQYIQKLKRGAFKEGNLVQQSHH